MEKRKLLEARSQEEAEEKRRLERLKDPIVEDNDSTDAGSSQKQGFVKIEEVEDEDAVTLTSNRDGSTKQELPGMLKPARSTTSWSEGIDRLADEVDDDDDDDFFDDPAPPQPDFQDDDDLDFNVEDVKPAAKKWEADDAASWDTAPAQVKKEERTTPEPGWKSVQQLVQFRATSVAIADDYLKQKGVKVHLKRTNSFTLRHGEWNIYNQGREDAKKIDVKRRRIKAMEED